MVQEKGIQVIKCAEVTLLKKKKRGSIGKAIGKNMQLEKDFDEKLIVKLLLILLFLHFTTTS